MPDPESLADTGRTLPLAPRSRYRNRTVLGGATQSKNRGLRSREPQYGGLSSAAERRFAAPALAVCLRQSKSAAWPPIAPHAVTEATPPIRVRNGCSS